MKQPLFSGVCTALVTPFLNDKVNYSLVERLLHRQLNAGVSAIVLSGTTGESPTLTDKEKIDLFRCGKNCVGNNGIIIAGTGSNNTSRTLELSIAAQEAGADALLIVAPYYNKGNSDGLISHYTAIAKNVDIPIIIYNVPSRTGVDIPVGVYRELAKFSNIVGVKEASTDITKVTKIRSICPDDFYIWSGNDDQIVPVISLGGKGVISVVSNILPVETVAMANAAVAGDFDTAADLQRCLLPLIELLFSEVNPIPVKYAMKYVGFDCGGYRLPLGKISEATRQKIDTFFH